MSTQSTVVSNIGLLITNGPEHEAADGLTDAWLVFEGEHVSEIGNGVVPAADRVIDAGGGCVVPGFVDSHTHLVFAGDRAAEFAARMAGQPYDGGGIRVTTEATRAATLAELHSLARQRLSRAGANGTTTIEIKSGYGLDVENERRILQVAEQYTSETTFLGAHLVPAEFEGRAGDYVDLVCGEMLDAAAPFARWIDAFCEDGAFDADQSRAVLEAGRAAGLGLRLHGNQLGPGPGVQLAVELGCASVDHCTYLTDDDVEALASSDTVATFLPATDFSTRQPYPDARRLVEAGASIAIASNCNPGSSYTSSMPFCLALAVRDLCLTSDEALQAATVGGAMALRRDDIGRLSPGYRGHAVILDAPSHHHFAYQPGQNLIRRTIGPLAPTEDRPFGNS